MLVKLEVTAKRNVPDALVVDLLPAGLELENQNLANSSASLQENGDAVQTCLTRCSRRIFSISSSAMTVSSLPSLSMKASR